LVISDFYVRNRQILFTNFFSAHAFLAIYSLESVASHPPHSSRCLMRSRPLPQRAGLRSCFLRAFPLCPSSASPHTDPGAERPRALPCPRPPCSFFRLLAFSCGSLSVLQPRHHTRLRVSLFNPRHSSTTPNPCATKLSVAVQLLSRTLLH